MTDGNAKIAYVSVVHPLHDHRFLYKQCKGLADNGFDVEYYVKTEKDCVVNNVKIIALKEHSNRLKRFLSDFSILPRLIKGRYNAVHLVDPELLPIGILLKLLTKSVIVFDAHEDYVSFMSHKHYLPSFLTAAFSAGVKFILHLSSLVLDGFVFADEVTEKEFKRLPNTRKILFRNFPLLSLFPNDPENWTERKYDVAFVGTMSRTSGTFVMLEAINTVKDKYPALKCLFIGQPGDEIKHKVEEYIKQINLDKHIEFTCRVPHSDVPNLLQQCRIGLIGLLDMPKFHKNIAAKMFEYLACGMPIVSSDLPPERKYIVSGEHGYLVPPGDSAAMAEAISKILSNPELGRKISKACRRYMLDKGYFAENEVEKLVKFYEYLLAHRRRPLCAS